MGRHSFARLASSAFILLAFACGEDTSTSNTSGAGGQGADGTGGAGATGAASSVGGGSTGGGGMAADPCDALYEELEGVLQATYAAESLPGGVSMGVRTPSCPIWTSSAGDDALSENALVKAGHISEMLVAAAVLRATEEGLLSLDDTLDTWEPTVPNADAITVRHLLNHTSGLPDYFDNQDFVDAFVAGPGTPWAPTELVAYSTALGANAAPGVQWDRTRVNYVLLGLVLQQVTGQTAHAAIRERVIEPIGLTSTGLGGPEASFGEVVDSYSLDDLEVSTLYHPSVDWIARSYVTTVPEILTLTRGILAGDLLSPASLSELQTFDVATVFPGVSNGLGVLEDAAYSPDLVGQEGTIVGFEVRSYYAADLDSVVVLVATHDDWATLGGLYAAFDAVAAVR